MGVTGWALLHVRAAGHGDGPRFTPLLDNIKGMNRADGQNLYDSLNSLRGTAQTDHRGRNLPSYLWAAVEQHVEADTTMVGFVKIYLLGRQTSQGLGRDCGLRDNFDFV